MSEPLIDQIKRAMTEVQQAKERKARLEGQHEQLIAELSEFGISSHAEAQTTLIELEQLIETDTARAEGMFARLKEKYGWE